MYITTLSNYLIQIKIFELRILFLGEYTLILNLSMQSIMRWEWTVQLSTSWGSWWNKRESKNHLFELVQHSNNFPDLTSGTHFVLCTRTSTWNYSSSKFKASVLLHQQDCWKLYAPSIIWVMEVIFRYYSKACACRSNRVIVGFCWN